MKSEGQLCATRAPALEALRVNIIVGRARAHLSQEDLAERAGVSRPTISRIERAVADVGVDTVQRIADALRTSVAELFVLERSGSLDDDQITRRAGDPNEEFIDADALFEALDEASGGLERYSKSGRPPVAR
jgi:transcriptional regulator with XRE-family HTH domain